MINTNLYLILLIFTRATTKNVPRVATATGRVKTGPVRAWRDLLGWPAIGCTALTSATGAVPASTRYGLCCTCWWYSLCNLEY